MDDHPKEGFLSRWSRLKTEGEPAAAAPPAAVEPAPPPCPADQDEDDDDGFDVDALPPLDSLGRDSDYSAFLHRKVPEALRKAALRKAWSSDPAITGYKPLVEYDWDCNAPGYAALRPDDDAAKVVAKMFKHLLPKEEDEAAEAAAEEGRETPDEDGTTERE